MAKACVFIEQRDGVLKKASLEILAACAKSGSETHAILVGDQVSSLASELGSYGASHVHIVQDPALKFYTPDGYTQAMVSVLQSLKPELILAAHSPLGRDFMPMVALELDAGLASDCIDVQFEGGKLKARRPLYAGKAMVSVEFVGSGPQVVTVRANTFGAPTLDASKKAEIHEVKAVIQSKVKVLEVAKSTSTRPDVSEASIVISGGRALKNAENFKILEEIADVIGAAVGASRAAVDAGYRGHRDQVGQTGKVVSPSLYIACGISGAIQHLAGMRTSKVIVAINSDAEAPIFQLADYGVVGDLFALLPLLKEEFKKLKN